MPDVIVTNYNANISASTKTANLLANTALANTPLDSDWYEVYVYAVSSAVGVNITLQSADQILINDNEILGVGTSLLESDHLLGSFMVAGGAPMILNLRETAGNATTDIAWKVVASPR